MSVMRMRLNTTPCVKACGCLLHLLPDPDGVIAMHLGYGVIVEQVGHDLLLARMDTAATLRIGPEGHIQMTYNGQSYETDDEQQMIRVLAAAQPELADLL